MGKLLIVADLAEKKYYAIPRGLELADKFGYTAEVLAFTHAPLKRLGVSATEQAQIKQRLLDERHKDVQQRIDKNIRPDQKVSLKVVWAKDIVKWINRHCAARSFEAVVKTGSRRDSLVHTPSDWQLLRHCPVPVLLVAESKWHRTKPILAALDLSSQVRSKQQLNHKILQRALEIAEVLDAELKIISAIEIPALLADLDLIDPIAYTREASETMQPHIKALAASHKIPESAFRVKRGPIEKVITSDAAQVRAQLVVLGTAARKGVTARLLGNTAEAVLTHLKTDVLAIKP